MYGVKEWRCATGNTSTRGSGRAGKTLKWSSGLWRLKDGRNFLETRTVERISQCLRCSNIFRATPYLHAMYYCCCAVCASEHLYTSFPNWRREEVRAKKNNLYYVAMIPYRKCLVNEIIWIVLPFVVVRPFWLVYNECYHNTKQKMFHHKIVVRILYGMRRNTTNATATNRYFIFLRRQ